MGNRQHGFTLIELLAAIAVILLVLGTFIGLFLGQAERGTCLKQLETVQAAAKLALDNRGDRVLCLNLKSLTESYNKQCGEKLGKLTLVECPP